MKKLTPTLVISLSILTSSCWATSKLKFKGETTKQNIEAPVDIVAIDAEDMFRIEVLQSNNKNSIELTYNKELSDKVEAYVDEHGTLKLGLTGNINNSNGSKLILRAKVYCKTINKVELDAMSQCVLTGTFNTTNFDASIDEMSSLISNGSIKNSGNAKISVEAMSQCHITLHSTGNCTFKCEEMSKANSTFYIARNLTLKVEEMSNATISGKAQAVNGYVEGMSKLNISKLESQDKKINTAGMSSCSGR